MGVEEPAGPSFEEGCRHTIGASQRGAVYKEHVAGTVLYQSQSAEVLRIGQEMSRTRFCAHDAWAVRLNPAPPPPPTAFGPTGAFAEEAFADQLAALRTGPPLDLHDFLCRQALVEQQWGRPDSRRAILHRLQREGQVRPARHFCYETSRDDGRYSERLGFSFPDLVHFCAKPVGKQILLELGQGSGACMDGRRPYAQNFMQVGCCDVLQYAVRDLLLAAIDKGALRQEIARLLGRPDWREGPEFWKGLCTFAAKVLVIRPGRTDRAEVPFDEDVLASLAADANALVEILRLKGSLLAQTGVVPASEGMPHPERPGEFLYPRQDRKPADPAFHAACDLLARGAAAHLLIGPGKRNALDVLPVYPCGAILGDFRDIAPRLRPGQVHVAVGVRSTQALDGEEYIDFMGGMTRLLTRGEADESHGIYVDDNARKNYGRHYPLEELREVEGRTGFPLYVVRGRGPEPWEEDVPVAVVATRSRAKLRFVAGSLRPGFRLQRPQELLDDAALMRRLPPWPAGQRRWPPT